MWKSLKGTRSVTMTVAAAAVACGGTAMAIASWQDDGHQDAATSTAAAQLDSIARDPTPQEMQALQGSELSRQRGPIDPRTLLKMTAQKERAFESCVRRHGGEFVPTNNQGGYVLKKGQKALAGPCKPVATQLERFTMSQKYVQSTRTVEFRTFRECVYRTITGSSTPAPAQFDSPAAKQCGADARAAVED